MKKQLLIFCLLSTCLVLTSTAQINYSWVKAINSGSPGDNIAKSVATDVNGNVYIAGVLSSGFFNAIANFNPYGASAVNVINPNAKNCYLAKYDSSGNCLWAKVLGVYTQYSDNLPVAAASQIAIDGANNIYVVGGFRDSVDFDPGAGEQNLKSKGLSDCFIAKYNTNGDYVWAKQFGGAGFDIGLSVAVSDANNQIFITGFYADSTSYFFDQNLPIDTLANAGGRDAFIASYANNGTLLWRKGIGSQNDDQGAAIAANDTYIAVSGYFQDTVNFNPEDSSPVYDTAESGDYDIFLAKYQVNGTFGWVQAFGKTDQAYSYGLGTSVKIDDNYNKIYLTGNFRGTLDFNPQNPGPNKLTSMGARDFFLTKYNLADGAFEWGYGFGTIANNGNDTTTATDIAIENSGDNVYMTGGFGAMINMNPQGTDTIESPGTNEMNIFLTKFDKDGLFQWVKNMGSVGRDLAAGVALDSDNNLFLTGVFTDTVDFDPSAFGTANRVNTNNFGNALFLAKYAFGSSTITGTVTRSGNIVSGGGKVKLYTQLLNDGNNAMHLVAEESIGGNGVYVFNDIPTGAYIILAKADSSHCLPTFYLQNSGTSFWQTATQIITQPNVIDTADIELIEFSALTGNAKLGGQVLASDGIDRTVKPVGGTPVGLERDPGNSIIAHTVTDSAGNYSFDHVDADSCYKIYVNIPGLGMASNYHVCPPTSDSIMTLDFFVDSASIDTVPSIYASVLQPKASETNVLLYPNPNNGYISIEFSINEPKWVKLELYNLIGENVASPINELKQTGRVQYKNIEWGNGLNPGVYLMKLQIGDHLINHKTIKTE